jgi:pSer/pThr/pTyr-binding forkhead associated (FHA) protein
MFGDHPTEIQQTGSIPRLSEREVRRAAAGQDRPGPGRFLAVVHGDEVVHVPLERAVTRLGRSIAADVHLDDPSVSRRHALVVERGDRVVLLDDRSMNGTWLNGERIREATLADGDVIGLGAVELRYLDGAA